MSSSSGKIVDQFNVIVKRTVGGRGMEWYPASAKNPTTRWADYDDAADGCVSPQAIAETIHAGFLGANPAFKVSVLDEDGAAYAQDTPVRLPAEASVGSGSSLHSFKVSKCRNLKN